MIAGGDDRGPGLRVVTTADQGCGWCCIKTVALYCIWLHSLIRLHCIDSVALHRFGGDAASEEHQTVFGKVLASRDLLDKAVIVARLTKEERQLVIQCDAALKRLGFLVISTSKSLVEQLCVEFSTVTWLLPGQARSEQHARRLPAGWTWKALP